MPLKCQDPNTGVHTCTIAHSHRHTRVHRHAHVCRLLHTDTVTETCKHGANLQVSRAPGPWRSAQISFILHPVRGRFLGKLTEMQVTWSPAFWKREEQPHSRIGSHTKLGSPPPTPASTCRSPQTVRRPASTESDDDSARHEGRRFAECEGKPEASGRTGWPQPLRGASLPPTPQHGGEESCLGTSQRPRRHPPRHLPSLKSSAPPLRLRSHLGRGSIAGCAAGAVTGP